VVGGSGVELFAEIHGLDSFGSEGGTDGRGGSGFTGADGDTLSRGKVIG
jgi:hypothetical protein